MEKKQNNLKIVIVLLVLIILLLIGFMIFVMEEFIDEKGKIENLYDSNDRNTNIAYNNNVYDDTNENYISRENALKIALDNAKLKQSDIRNIDVELDYKYGQIVYEVNFDYQLYEYEYYINAEDGSILKSFKEID